MRFLTGGLLLAFLLVAYSSAYAQTGSPGLHGNVSDEKKIAAEAATVILLNAADSSIIKSTSCNEKGAFRFSATPGEYLLLVSKIGYDQSITGPYTIPPNHDITVNDIILTLHLPQLKEVSITAQRAYVEVRPGKVILNVQNSIIAEGNSVADILKQAPGVNVDSRSNISIIGRQRALVTIDGKLTTLTGQDLTDLLQGMPGNAVQQIELITNPSSKYEAAGGGIINIVTKKGNNAGTNFTVNATAGYGKYYKAGAGLVFNNRMGIINIFGNYNYFENKTFHLFTNSRTINYNGLTSQYNVNYNATQLSKSNNFRVGTDIALSPNHTIGVLVSGTVTNNVYDKNNGLSVLNQGRLDSTIATVTNTNRNQSNINYDLNYTGKIDGKGQTLSVDFAFNNVNRHSSEYIDNRFYNAAGTNYRDPLYLQNLSPANIHIWAAKVDYVNAISKTSQIEAGVKYSKVKSDNDLVFGPKVNGVYTSSPLFSSMFLYDENINSAYVNYISKIGKVSVIAGLRAEQTNSDGKGTSVIMVSTIDKNYLNLFPQLQLNYQADEKNEFNFSYNRGIERAAYDAVNPFLYYVDLYDYRAGNPNLLPQYTNKIQITHTYKKTFVTTLYGSVTNDFYDLNNYFQNDSSKVSITTKSNFGTYSILGIKLFTPVTFTNWWTANFLLDASYQRFKAYPQNGDLNKGTQYFVFSSTQNFKITSTFAAEVSGKYESPTFYGIGQFKANYWVNAALSKRIFNKNGTLRLGITDIFNTTRDRDMINYKNLNMMLYDKVETRVVKLSFIYRFGNISLKGIIKHNSSNEDEQNRAAGGLAGTASN